MTIPVAAMVFAAGFGTRMGDLTRDRPKPLLRIGEDTLLDHTLDQIADAKIERAVVNLHYRGDQIRAHLEERERPRIQFSDEQPDILETGGGIVNALPELGPSPFATVNADTVFLGANPFDILANAWTDNTDALLLLVPTEQTLGYTRAGDFFLDTSTGIPRRRGDAASAPFVYAGAQIIRPEAFINAPPGAFSLNVIWNQLLAAGRLHAAIYPDKWVDVGTPDGLALADQALVQSV